jgi:hypothetical protein
MTQDLGFFQRLLFAFVAFFAVLVNGEFAARVRELRARQRAGLPPVPASPPATSPPEPAPAPAPAARQEVRMEPPRPQGGEALHLLSLFQRDGRLVDFLSEELAGFSDSEIGAAARTVHEGCKKVLSTYVTLEPVLADGEGATVTVPAGFDAASIRVTGNVVGAPPFRGTVRHHGWRAKDVRIPPPAPGDARVVAPAEVEL